MINNFNIKFKDAKTVLLITSFFTLLNGYSEVAQAADPAAVFNNDNSSKDSGFSGPSGPPPPPPPQSLLVKYNTLFIPDNLSSEIPAAAKSALLSAIRNGTTLKKASDRKVEEVKVEIKVIEKKPLSLMEELANNFGKQRKTVVTRISETDLLLKKVEKIISDDTLFHPDLLETDKKLKDLKKVKNIKNEDYEKLTVKEYFLKKNRLDSTGDAISLIRDQLIKAEEIKKTGIKNAQDSTITYYPGILSNEINDLEDLKNRNKKRILEFKKEEEKNDPIKQAQLLEQAKQRRTKELNDHQAKVTKLIASAPKVNDFKAYQRELFLTGQQYYRIEDKPVPTAPKLSDKELFKMVKRGIIIDPKDIFHDVADMPKSIKDFREKRQTQLKSFFSEEFTLPELRLISSQLDNIDNDNSFTEITSAVSETIYNKARQESAASHAALFSQINGLKGGISGLRKTALSKNNTVVKNEAEFTKPLSVKSSVMAQIKDGKILKPTHAVKDKVEPEKSPEKNGTQTSVKNEFLLNTLNKVIAAQTGTLEVTLESAKANINNAYNSLRNTAIRELRLKEREARQAHFKETGVKVTEPEPIYIEQITPPQFKLLVENNYLPTPQEIFAHTIEKKASVIIKHAERVKHLKFKEKMYELAIAKPSAAEGLINLMSTENTEFAREFDQPITEEDYKLISEVEEVIEELSLQEIIVRDTARKELVKKGRESIANANKKRNSSLRYTGNYNIQEKDKDEKKEDGEKENQTPNNTQINNENSDERATPNKNKEKRPKNNVKPIKLDPNELEKEDEDNELKVAQQAEENDDEQDGNQDEQVNTVLQDEVEDEMEITKEKKKKISSKTAEESEQTNGEESDSYLSTNDERNNDSETLSSSSVTPIEECLQTSTNQSVDSVERKKIVDNVISKILSNSQDFESISELDEYNINLAEEMGTTDEEIALKAGDDDLISCETLENNVKTYAAAVQTLSDTEMVEAIKYMNLIPEFSLQFVDSLNSIALSERYSAVAAGDEDESKKIITPRGVWTTGLYGKSNQKSYKNIASYKGLTSGGVIGFDFDLFENSLIGIAYSRVGTKFNFGGSFSGNKVLATSDIYSIYGQTALTNKLELNAQVSFNNTKVKTTSKRLISAQNLKNASGSYNSKSFNAEGNLIYNLYNKNNIKILPSLGFKYSNQHDGAFAEHGAGIQNLSVSSKKNQNLFGIYGVKAVYFKQFANGLEISPSISTSIENAITHKSSKIKSKLFWSGKDFDQEFNMAKPQKFAYNMGVGLLAKYRNMEMLATYNYHTKKKYNSHQGALNLRVLF